MRFNGRFMRTYVNIIFRLSKDVILTLNDPCLVVDTTFVRGFPRVHLTIFKGPTFRRRCNAFYRVFTIRLSFRRICLFLRL